jgi:hypothetical protein
MDKSHGLWSERPEFLRPFSIEILICTLLVVDLIRNKRVNDVSPWKKWCANIITSGREVFLPQSIETKKYCTSKLMSFSNAVGQGVKAGAPHRYFVRVPSHTTENHGFRRKIEACSHLCIKYFDLFLLGDIFVKSGNGWFSGKMSFSCQPTH